MSAIQDLIDFTYGDGGVLDLDMQPGNEAQSVNELCAAAADELAALRQRCERLQRERDETLHLVKQARIGFNIISGGGSPNNEAIVDWMSRAAAALAQREQ